MKFKFSAILWDGKQPRIKIDPLEGDIAWQAGDPSEINVKLRMADRKLGAAWWQDWLLRFWRKLEFVLVVQLKRADGQPPGLGWELAQAEGRRADS